MTHPSLPVEHPSHLVVKDSDCLPLQPGIWYYKIVEGDHILFVVNRERAGVQFDLIYDSIFERCRKHALRKLQHSQTKCQNSYIILSREKGRYTAVRHSSNLLHINE